MNGQFAEVEPVRIGDLGQITQLVFANMTGVDQQFTVMTRHWFSRLYNQITIPLYLLTSGWGFKVMRGGQIAGFAFLSLRPQSGYIFNVVVDHPFRRMGVGRLLMTYLEQSIRQQGRIWATLQVDAGNEPAQTLYQSLGYQSYHPHFWHWPGARWLRQEISPSARLVGVRGRGRTLYHHFATLERETGDAWAANLVGNEYSLPRPTQGQEWRCVWQGQDIGYAWVDGGDEGAGLILLWHPQWWGQGSVLSFVQLLLDEVGRRRGVIDLHLGSSGHDDAAAAILKPLGFVPRTQPRILMLKNLADKTLFSQIT